MILPLLVPGLAASVILSTPAPAVQHPVHKPPSVTAPVQPGTGQHPPGYHLSCRELQRLWVAQGGPRRHAVLASAVAKAESHGWTGARRHNPGSVDRGLWQLNSYFVGSRYSKYNIRINARGAVLVSEHGTDFTPWVSYSHGAEIGKCGYRPPKP